MKSAPADWFWRGGFWAALAACTWLALTPSPPDPVTRISDVILHAFAFTTLTFLLHQAHLTARWLLLLVAMLTYGVMIELVQSQLSARSAELKDVWVDLLGIVIGMAMARLLGAWAAGLVARILNPP